MKAVRILHEKLVLKHADGDRFATFEIIAWDVGKRIDYPDGIKFRAWVSERGATLFGFDNHKPKGPHMHLGERELAYNYSGIEQLKADVIRLIEMEGFVYES